MKTSQEYERRAGKTQIKEFSITDAANAGVVTIATMTDQPCDIESVVLHSNGATTGDLTSAAIEGGVGQVVEIINAASAIQASLDAADKQVWWKGAIRLAAGKIITIDLQGTGANAVDFIVSIKYRACITGGYLT